MLTPTDIAEYGERHVENWLKANSYHCHRAQHTSQPHGHGPHAQSHHCDIELEARNAETNLIVHVRTALAPNAVHDLTEAEQHRLTARAMMLGYEAWLAKVQIDSNGELASDVAWAKLM